jgi:hypothetical protein
MGALNAASRPYPADGALLTDTWVNLTWQAGGSAASHNVYLGDNFDDVSDGTGDTFRGNQTEEAFIVGFFGFPYPDGLVEGTTYYWRIDEVNDTDPNSPWKGPVWSFMIQPRIAYEPTPADGAKFVSTDVTLSWMAGIGAKLHYLYFGDNFDDVNNAVAGQLLTDTTYTPGTLEFEKTYYWRVDESDGTTTFEGDVWSFTTLPDITITDPNMVGWWKFETGAGNNVIDFSGHGNHGTIVDKVLWAPGQFNLALEFLGDNQGHVELPARMVTTASGSVAMWINTDQAGIGDAYSEGMFWYGTETGGDGFGGENEIHIHNQGSGALGFALEGTTDVRLDGPMLAGTGWNHVGATWDQTDGCRLYFNGLQADFQAYTGNVADLAVIRLGRPAGNFRFHDGLMDDVRLFDHAITAAQVSEIMTKGEDPRRAGAPSPGNGALVPVNVASSLNWSAGEGASQHDVYFGADQAAVAGADASDTTGVYRGRQNGTSYTPPEGVPMSSGPHYWRIDEVANDGTIVEGGVWSFSVADYLLIDDFESYNDIEAGQPGSNLVYLTWLDGFDNPATNGSTIGYTTGASMETGTVHGGRQSVPYAYDNNFKSSQATRTLTSLRDWTQEGVATLSLWFYGDPANAPERMSVALNGAAPVYHADPSAATIGDWTQWPIPLSAFGVDLTNVTSITIGFGVPGSTAAGGTGNMLFDDLHLIR